MMEVLQNIAYILICFALLVAFLILTVNLVEAVCQKWVARRRSQVVRRRSANPLNVGSIPAAASRSRTGSDNELATETRRR
jgi:peptidoglycan/LPS O-acetylase OafA/YrhL